MTEEFHARKEEQISRQGAKLPRYKLNILLWLFLAHRLLGVNSSITIAKNTVKSISAMNRFFFFFLGDFVPWREPPNIIRRLHD
jgi:hypothetical protein